MRIALVVIILQTLLVSAPALAAPADEVAALLQAQGQAFGQGNLDVYIGNFADNAVFTSAQAGLRFEGKQAIRTWFTTLFQDFPTRRGLGRHGITRFYASDSVAVSNAYNDLAFIDRAGQVSRIASRITTVLVKMNGGWKIVEQHVSQIPAQ
jgi:uncharacterized protein (TIGR02246 family)